MTPLWTPMGSILDGRYTIAFSTVKHLWIKFYYVSRFDLCFFVSGIFFYFVCINIKVINKWFSFFSNKI